MRVRDDYRETVEETIRSWSNLGTDDRAERLRQYAEAVEDGDAPPNNDFLNTLARMTRGYTLDADEQAAILRQFADELEADDSRFDDSTEHARKRLADIERILTPDGNE